MTAIYDILQVLPLSLLMMLLFGGYAGIPEKNSFGYALCVLLTASFVLLRHMKRKNRLRVISLITVFLFGLHLAAGEEYRMLLIDEYFWIIWVVCISIAALLTGMLTDRSIWFKRVITAAMLVYCIIGTVLAWQIGQAEFALFCFWLLVHLAEEIQRRWHKSGDPEQKAHITSIAPLLLAVCLIVYAVPHPDKPYDWKFVKDLYAAAETGLHRLYGCITHLSDDYGNIGFSDNGGFFAGLGENDEDVLVIRVNHTTVRNFRLVGCISGEFRNSQWIFDTRTESDGVSRMTDTMETACAVKKFDVSSRADYLQKLDMQYENLFYNTQYIFSPAKTKLETTKDTFTGLSDKNGSIVAKKNLHYQDQFTVSCYVLNYSHPQLKELLCQAKPLTETEWEQMAITEKTHDKAGYSFADYQAYRREVYDKFCHSYGVSEEVQTILDEIRNGSQNRYEAMKHLEAYLQQLEYSTNCGALPASVSDGGSFLDYFLLSSQKGYCMHFATAFVLMAQEMGVPCRYVQGYNVTRDAFGTIRVKQNNAHAWPEVYFDNAGWVAFEPTPGYSVSTGWDVQRNSVMDAEEEETETETETAETSIPTEEAEDEPSKLHPLVFIIPSVSVISFLLLFCLVSRLAKRRNYRRMPHPDKFRYLTHRCLRLLGYLGFQMTEGETLSEFSDRVMQTDRQEIREALGFIAIYEAFLYSDREIHAEDVQYAETIYAQLRKEVRNSNLKYRLLLLIDLNI